MSRQDWGRKYTDEPAPIHHVRWFHGGPPALLSAAPIVTSSIPTWQPLTREESDACEASWQELNPEARLNVYSPRDGSAGGDDDDTDETLKVGIPVSSDRLFEVDVRSMQVIHSFVIAGYFLTPSHSPALSCVLEIGHQDPSHARSMDARRGRPD